jgi:acyl transferase domain-containing protein/NAD(P)-dependent dehydrogenase (short-subunit alcohol dehydrogenase family)/acyl carrier protein/ubiquinone/menaquinone biosynthesis C-methylase UbiE/GNAT superfamily N-acetyltransferase
VLEILNSYAHGFVAVPIIDSCRRGGVIEALEAGGQWPPCNRGHLTVALRLLESLGWLNEDHSLIEAGTLAYTIPDVRTLYTEDLTQNSDWLRQAEQGWPGLPAPLHALMDGAVLTPLLPKLTTELPNWLSTYFTRLGWLERGELTEKGSYMLERGMILGTTASYRPMLSRVDELLFGDPRKVFQRGADGREGHLDRTLNVTASGFQHHRYFQDLRRVLKQIFDGPTEQQPFAVCDMGCGDGSLLKSVYQSVLESDRDLSTHPIMLVAADYNSESLKAAADTLEGLPHTLVHADIGDPAQLLTALKSAGIPPEKTLHIRSFLDHNRPYKKPTKMSLGGSGVFVDERGDLIESREAVQSLVEHLERWSEILTGQGLLLLEVHSLPPRLVRRFLDQTENLHFDAYHALSGQFLVEAHTFLRAAAEAGLFPRRSQARRYPRSLPITRITLSWMQKKEHRVIPLEPSHLERLVQLESQLLAEPLLTPRDELRRRLEEWPDFQLGLVKDGRLVGAAFAQPVKDLHDLTYGSQGARADATGDKAQLLGLLVHPEFSGLGDQLLDFVLQYLSVVPGIREIVGVTRCRDALQAGVASVQELSDYAERDPIVKFHRNHGAKLLGLLENYRPDDTDNLGCGLLISYDPKNLNDSSRQRTTHQGDVNGLIGSVLEPEQDFDPTLPLRDLGLDSLALMELRTLLEGAYRTNLDSGFFFRYRTAQEIADYLERGKSKALPQVTGATHSRSPEPDLTEAVVVVGIGCRYPHINSPQDFWDTLCAGRTTVADSHRSFSGLPPASFLDNVADFDERFFRIAPREAAMMDPQHRLLLEVSWEALEHAAIPPDSLRGRSVGSYIGLFSHDYETLHKDVRGRVDGHTALATSSSAAAGRLAYYYGWNGPALAIHTACSSSLVAVHLARKALLDRECDVALAGGVNLMLTSDLSEVFQQAGMLSPDGRCKPFQAGADGYGRGEGCGLVVLKRLSCARRDGDRILAVLRASAMNQDGASNGLTAPNQEAQEQLHLTTLKEAGAKPEDLVYLEAHGTGTALGDPIEMEAIQSIHTRQSRGKPLMVGSVKANLGHTEAAAGVTGLIKAVLALHHKRLPPQPNLDKLSPHIRWGRAPVEVISDNQVLPEGLVAVSSFGFTGTNCQVLLEALTQESPIESTPPHLITLSAHTPEALSELISEFKSETALPLATLASTSSAGRSHFPHRFAALCETPSQWQSQLHDPDIRVDSGEHDTVFMFTGQGSQYVGMGEELYRQEPVFRHCLDELTKHAEQHLERPLLEIMFKGHDLLHDTRYTQPALYCFQLALAALWRSWGVQPAAVLGHSVGEFAAAQMAGVFRPEEGLRLVVARGRLMSELPQDGGMSAVLASPQEVRGLLTEGVEIACYNGPSHLVIAGPREKLVETFRALEAAGFEHRELSVSHAFHCSLMDPMLDAFSRVLETVNFRAPQVPFYSNLTGQQVLDCGAEYWRKHARDPVRFQQGLEEALKAGRRLFLELGPAAHLCGMARRFKETDATLTARWIPSCQGGDARRDLLRAVRELYLCGLDLNFKAIQPGPKGDLPRYPWQRTRHWLQRPFDLVGTPLEVAAGPCHFRQTVLSPGQEITPLHWLEAACQVGKCLELRRIAFPEPLVLNDETEIQWVIQDTTMEAMGRSSGGVWKCHFKTDYVAGPKPDDGNPEPATTGLPAPNSWHFLASYGRHRSSQPQSLSRRSDGAFDLLDANGAIVGQIKGVVERDTADWPSWLYRLSWEEGSAPPLGRGVVPIATFEPTPMGQSRTDILALESLALEYAKKAFECSEGLPDTKQVRHLARFIGRKLPPSGEPKPGSECQLLNRCGPWLREVITGAKNPLQVLIPQGDTRALADFYESTDTFVAVNKDVSRLVAQMRRPGQRLRILEVGAGTGATTRRVLEGLDPGLTDYTFTDISSAFFNQSPQQVTTKLLNIERSPEEQGFRSGSYDLVVAANVLHATANLKEALAHIRWLLAPGGSLVFVEGTQQRLWVDLTFGLTDGWWRCADRDYPLLTSKRWKETLLECGFENIQLFEPQGQEFFPQVIGCAYQPEAQCSLVKNREDLARPLDQEILVKLDQGDASLLLQLVQNTRARLWVVVPPHCSELSGFCRTLALEQPDRLGGMLQLPDGDAPDEVLWQWMDSSREVETAWSAGRWLYPRLERINIPNSSFQPEADRSYLITGGLNGLGLALAQRLVRLGARAIHLVSRRAHPESQETVEQLRRSGARVTTHLADVTNVAQMKRVVQQATPLAGVFHSAGVLDDAPIREMTEQQMHAVVQTKLLGALVLVQVTAEEDLKNFILFSSSSSILGSPGQCNHAAACSALDGLAQELRRSGLPALSINWGAWANIGSASSSEVATFMAARGLMGMDPEQALDALQALLAADTRGHVMVADVRWPVWASRFGAGEMFKGFIEEEEQSPSAPPDTLENQLCQDLAQVLGIASRNLVPRDVGFFDLGLDSLTSMEFRHRLQKRLGRELPSSICFDYPTVEKLLDFLEQGTECDELRHIVVPPEIAQMSEEQLMETLGEELGLLETHR